MQVGSGLAHLIPHASSDCLDVLTKLLVYDPDERYAPALPTHVRFCLEPR